MNRAFFYYIRIFVASLALNILFIPYHEMGHAILYWFQGIDVEIHFTQVVLNPDQLTFLGESGGILFNLIAAVASLWLLNHLNNIYLFLVISANTFFPRILLWILHLGRPLNDERMIGEILEIHPNLVGFVVFMCLSAVLIFAIKIILANYGRRYTFIVGSVILISSIASLLVLSIIE